MQPQSDSDKPSEEVARITRRFVTELLTRDWKPHTEKSGVALFTTVTQWTDKKAMRVVTFIPGVSLKDVEAVLNDLSLASSCDPTIESKAIVATCSPGVGLTHTKFKSPVWGVASRDMVTRVVTAHYPDAAAQQAMGLSAIGLAGGTRPVPTGGRAVFIHAGEDAATELTTTNKYTRGHCYVFGVLAEEADDETGGHGVWFVHAAAADPGGSLPTALVDMVLVGQIEKVQNIVKLIKKRASEKK